MVTDKTYLAWQAKLKSNKWFRRFWVFWGIYIVGFFYLGFGFFLFTKYRLMAGVALAAFLFAKLILCEIIYFFYKRKRPYQRLNFKPPHNIFFLSDLHERFNSMPSGHAASLVAISTAAFIFFPLIGALGFVAAFFNGVGRVILGYHHPSDIVAGWLVGILSALVMVYLVIPLLFTH